MAAVRLEAKPLAEATDWLENYRLFWEQSFACLDNYLIEAQNKGERIWAKKMTLLRNRRNGFSSAVSAHTRGVKLRPGASYI
jgi:hypothetical protein